MYMLYMCMLEYSLILTLGSLLVAALERYICITKPIFHRRYVLKKHVIFGTAIVWLISFVPPLTLISLMGFQYVESENLSVTIYSCVFDVVMLMLIAASVALLVQSLRVSKRSCDKRTARSTSITMRNTTSKTTMRLVTIFMCMIVAYAVTFLPFAGTRLLYDLGVLESLPITAQIVIFIVCNTFYKSSSLFNPILSISLKKDYWHLLLAMFSCKLGHGNVVLYRRRLKRQRAVYRSVKKRISSSTSNHTKDTLLYAKDSSIDSSDSVSVYYT